MNRAIIVTVLVLFLAGAASAAVELNTMALTEITTTNEAGQEMTTRVPAGKVVPGALLSTKLARTGAPLFGRFSVCTAVPIRPVSAASAAKCW